MTRPTPAYGMNQHLRAADGFEGCVVGTREPAAGEPTYWLRAESGTEREYREGDLRG